MAHMIVVAAAALILVGFIGSAASAAAPKIDTDVPDRGIYSLRPAPRWEEALLIGNGKMGGLVMSQPFDETIMLTHERLFLPVNEDKPTVETASHLDEIRQLIRGGKYAEAAGLVMKLDKEQGGPGRLVWTDPFFPACDLRITLDGDAANAANAAPADYRRSLDYATGVARAQYTDADTLYQQRTFISRPDNALVLELTATGAKRLTGKVAVVTHPLAPDAGKEERQNAERAPNAPPASLLGKWIVLRQPYRKGPGGYEVVARVGAVGGETKTDNGAIRVEGATRITVLLRILPLGNMKKSDVDRMTTQLDSLGEDFDGILKRHVAVHGAIYGRQRLDLGGGDARRGVPSEKLWEQTHGKAATPALLEQVFDAGRYEILCSCGDWPPNLQGVWAGDWKSPWSCSYTIDGNLAAAIANLLNGNMPELMEALFTYYDERMEHFRTNAKRHYGTRGIFLPVAATRFGHDTSYNQTYCMTFWTAGAAWYAGFYYDYYLYTGDEKFLTDRALPFMKEAAAFYEDFLVKDASGVYEFNPSYSPENNPANSKSQAAINATMDVAACRKLLLNLIEICTRRGIEEQNVGKWRSLLAQLPEYMIGENGELKEWCTPLLKDNHDHRHCSHFLAMWYGLDPAIAADPALIAAAKKAVRLRSDYRKRTSGVMAFGEMQIGLAAASLGDAESVWGVLDRLSTVYYYPTFASSHNAGPTVFNADISGGLPAVIVEMLVQSQPGHITLLPALPKELPAGSITGVPCRGQVTVERLAWSPETFEFKLSSPMECEVSVDYVFQGKRGAAKFRLGPNRPGLMRIGKP